MNGRIETMLRIARMIAEAKHETERLTGWTQADLRDERLGKDLDALRQHLDNAHGRCSTVIDDLRRTQRG